MSRAFILMLDSFGIGATNDAAKYNDAGADTLRHIAEYCFANKANKKNVRNGPLLIPNLCRLGINKAAQLSQGSLIKELPDPNIITGRYGCAEEKSFGKDTQSGHWELAGVPVLFEWGYFRDDPSFPDKLLNALIERAQLPGLLGNKHASGTTIIEELGAEHQQTGKPIIYTSADSVVQIAAHEGTFGLEKLYRVCDIARALVDEYNIGRVIARPFLGTPGHYIRTGNRRDYATPPPSKTLLDNIIDAGGTVIAIGKIADIYAHQGISKSYKAHGNQALCDTFLREARTAPEQSLSFVNLVDFDMEYGHRRDVIGYAHALETFDRWLPHFEKILQINDLAIITADHGCDPTMPGSDHTREHIPILAFGPSITPGSIGKRNTFADIGQSIAQHLHLPQLKFGTSFV